MWLSPNKNLFSWLIWNQQGFQITACILCARDMPTYRVESFVYGHSKWDQHKSYQQNTPWGSLTSHSTSIPFQITVLRSLKGLLASPPQPPFTISLQKTSRNMKTFHPILRLPSHSVEVNLDLAHGPCKLFLLMCFVLTFRALPLTQAFLLSAILSVWENLACCHPGLSFWLIPCPWITFLIGSLPLPPSLS